MHQPKTWERTALLLLVAIQLWVFSGSFPKYFNLDSAWYVIHSPRSWGELPGLFTAPDPGKQFRPVTLAFMALFVPIFKLNPYPYHWIPIVFHIANTCLLFVLARRLLNGSIAVVAATAFWGLHSVAGWITYDTTCTPDFMQAFFLLACLILAVDGSLKRSRVLIGGSIAVYILALLTKESSLTIPLALLICLVLARIRAEEGAPGTSSLSEAFRKALPLTTSYLLIAMVHAGILFRWLRSDLLYTQGAGAAYSLGLWSNALAKSKYIYWAMNLPDALVIPHAIWIRPLVLGLMSLFIVGIILEILWRGGRQHVSTWAGVVWFVGMSVPALMLSNRVAKWYLYVPLLGLSFTVGTVVQSIPERLKGWKARVAIPAVLAMCIIPTLFSSVTQTRSYLRSSDAAFASGVLQSFYRDLRQAFPAPPKRATVLILPSFEPEISAILSYIPSDTRKLLELYWPGTSAKILFAHKGDRLSAEQLRDPDTRIFQDLYGRYHDVTRYYKRNGRMTLFVLPTPERQAPPLLKKEPIGGWKLYGSHVQVLLADEGAVLPADLPSHDDLWILQYLDGRFFDVSDRLEQKGEKELILLPALSGDIPPLSRLEQDAGALGIDGSWRISLPRTGEKSGEDSRMLGTPNDRILQYLYGHFVDVTDYDRGRRRRPARRVIQDLRDLQTGVNREEFYPDYSRFSTPTGSPVFFSTPQKEILTQIGGSTAVVPVGLIGSNATLCFDISWMFDAGDGGWAEMFLRSGGRETVIFRRYMHPNPIGAGPTWQEVRISLAPFAGQQAALVLTCRNEKGKNTVADWLNWRDIAIE